MNETATMDAIETRRYREASQWLLRLNGDNPAEGEVAEWLRWCEEHPRNLKAFEAIQADWRDIVTLRQDAAFCTLETWEPRNGTASRAFERQWSWRIAAAAAFLAVLLSAAWWNPLQHWQRFIDTQHIAAANENKTTSLPDGSLLVLRAQAEVKVNFAAVERRLELKKDGEAYFNVKRDPQRPFIVQAGELTIQAIGTAFDVRHDAKLTRVVVEQGSVRVSSPAQQWVLEAGHTLEYSRQGNHAVLAGIDAGHALRWRDGEFAYDKVALEEVIQDINRYSTVKITIPDTRVRELPYTGTVFVRSIDDWLDALALKYPVRKRIAANGDIALEPAESP